MTNETNEYVTNETNENFCVNCQAPLHKFIAADRRGIYSYCMDVRCYYSSLYDSNYEIARNYFMEYGKNVGGFRFYDEKVSEENDGLSLSLTVDTIKPTILPTIYNLDFSQIFGHESVKETIIDVVNSDKSINLILSGSPSTSKTFFLKLVQKSVEAQGATSLFVDCATSSFSGLAAEIDRVKPDFIFLDELEAYNFHSQKALLNLLEFQTIHLSKHRNTKTIHLPNLKVLATCNMLNRLLEPLRSRMLIMYLKAPNELEFKFIARKMLLSRYDYISEELAEYIGSIVWKTQNPYLRLVDRIGIMAKNDPTKEKVDSIIENLKRYSIPQKELVKLRMQR